MKGVGLPQTSFSWEIIYDALFWKPVPNAIDWFTPMIEMYGFVVIRLK